MTLFDCLNWYREIRESDNIYLLLSDYDLDTRLDKDLMDNVLLQECGSCIMLYEKTEVLKTMIEAFFKKYKWNIGKLIDTMEVQYNLAYDRDLYTDTDESIKRNLERGVTGNDNTVSSTDAKTVSASTNTESVSAYNATTFQPARQATYSGNQTDTVGTNTSKTSVDQINENESTGRDNDKHEYGRTGRTPIQEWLAKERINDEFNIYQWIANQFTKELCILVY